MTSTIVALFDDRSEAERAKNDLIKAGFVDSGIRLMAQPGTSTTTAASRGGDTGKSFWEEVKEFFGVGNDEERLQYEEGLRRGGTLLTIGAPGNRVDDAVDILMRHNPVDIDKRAAEWQVGSAQSSGRAQATSTVGASRAAAIPASQQTATAQAEQHIPVVEEQLKVGKRQLQRGVRILQHVTTKPVQEEVTLRDERVTVQRRPADRPASGAAGTFQEKTFNVTETHEEPVVSKQARVVEEVVVGREAHERTETVRDTVRRTDVQVQQPGQTSQSSDDDIRKIYDKEFAGKGYTYEQYKPAYDYGRELATDQRFRGRDWSTLEPEARRDFEKSHPGSTWEKARDAIRRAYDGAKAKV
jgi:uncharacterized protein (TIGR02271 family)